MRRRPWGWKDSALLVVLILFATVFLGWPSGPIVTLLIVAGIEAMGWLLWSRE